MEQNRCLIKNLEIYDKIGLWVTCFIMAIISISLSTFLLFFSFKCAYILKMKINFLFAINPSIKFCVYISLCILLYIIVFIYTFYSYKYTIIKFFHLISHDMHKLIFIDEDGNILYIKYETLSWLEDKGYKLLYPKDLQDDIHIDE